MWVLFVFRWRTAIVELLAVSNLSPPLLCRQTAFCMHDMSVWLLIQPTLICLEKTGSREAHADSILLPIPSHCSGQELWVSAPWCAPHHTVHLSCSFWSGSLGVSSLLASGLHSYCVHSPCLLGSSKVEFVSWFQVILKGKNELHYTISLYVCKLI